MVLVTDNEMQIEFINIMKKRFEIKAREFATITQSEQEMRNRVERTVEFLEHKYEEYKNPRSRTTNKEMIYFLANVLDSVEAILSGDSH